MPMDRSQTIFALASAPGKAGVAIVRVSGAKAGLSINLLTGKKDIVPRQARFLSLYDTGGVLIDRALVLFFQAPKSFTGEDVAEFHLHGGRAVVDALCSVLTGDLGLRPAEPGEFTRRAVENGKLDLTQAEAIADLVDAETEAQRRQAVRQYEGVFGQKIEEWRDVLVRALALAEVDIDFSDEEVPEDSVGGGRILCAEVREAISAQLADRRRGELIREGLQVAVIGPPNAGKSSLVNALARRDVAIVSSIPGTTRDVIEVRLNLDGYAVVLADTAGLRDPTEEIEAEGVRRALQRAGEADMVVLLRDGVLGENPINLPESMVNKPYITVWNKSDLFWPVPQEGLRVSATTGEGIDAVVAAIAAKAKEMLGGSAAPLTRPRHRYCLEEALSALVRAQTAKEPELFAEDVRLALRALGRIVGKVDVEDVLDIVFRDFCIGK
jgi:tRNA modification GTPase